MGTAAIAKCPEGYNAILNLDGSVNHCQLPFGQEPEIQRQENLEIAASLNAAPTVYAQMTASQPQVLSLPNSVQEAIQNAGLFAYSYTTYGTVPPAPYNQFISSAGAIDMPGLQAYFLARAGGPANGPAVTWDPNTGLYAAAPVANIPTVIIPVQRGTVPGDTTSPNVQPPTVTPLTVAADAHPGTIVAGSTIEVLPGYATIGDLAGIPLSIGAKPLTSAVAAPGGKSNIAMWAVAGVGAAILLWLVLK